jgi:hypothetical protein
MVERNPRQSTRPFTSNDQSTMSPAQRVTGFKTSRSSSSGRRCKWLEGLASVELKSWNCETGVCLSSDCCMASSGRGLYDPGEDTFAKGDVLSRAGCMLVSRTVLLCSTYFGTALPVSVSLRARCGALSSSVLSACCSWRSLYRTMSGAVGLGLGLQRHRRVEKGVTAGCEEPCDARFSSAYDVREGGS